MTTTPSRAPSRGNSAGRRGSNFSDKQVAQSVKDRTPVRVTLADDSVIDGWIYGMDDFHWGIVDSGGDTYLVHKSAPALQFLSYPVLKTGERDSVAEKTEPFRDYVMRNFFAQHQTASN